MLSSKSNVVARGLSALVPDPFQVRAQPFHDDAGQRLDRRAVLRRRLLVAVEPGPDVALPDQSFRGGQGACEGGLPSSESDGFFEGGLFHARHNTTLAVGVNNFGGLTATPEAVTVPPMNLGERVTAARKHAGFTQAALAERVKIKQQTLQKLESGKSEKSAALAEICLETGVSLNWLVRGEGEMLSSQTARPDPVILARAVTVLRNLASLQAGAATFLYDAPSILSIYDAVSRLPPDVDLDREAILGRMAAVLRGVSDGKGMGRGGAVGAGGDAG